MSRTTLLSFSPSFPSLNLHEDAHMNKKTTIVACILLVLALLITLSSVTALPTGATITTNSTAATPTPTASNRSDARGTITTIVINGLQQDQNWKAYVGNITGKLSLDNAAGLTIYDW